MNIGVAWTEYHTALRIDQCIGVQKVTPGKYPQYYRNQHRKMCFGPTVECEAEPSHVVVECIETGRCKQGNDQSAQYPSLNEPLEWHREQVEAYILAKNGVCDAK